MHKHLDVTSNRRGFSKGRVSYCRRCFFVAQARYGSAVASYFHFYRWLVGSYILLASPSLVWIVFHLLDQGSAAIFNVSLIGAAYLASTPSAHDKLFKFFACFCVGFQCHNNTTGARSGSKPAEYGPLIHVVHIGQFRSLEEYSSEKRTRSSIGTGRVFTKGDGIK